MTGAASLDGTAGVLNTTHPLHFLPILHEFAPGIAVVTPDMQSGKP